MVERWPDKIKLKKLEEPTQDKDGLLIYGDETKEVIKCRVKPASEREVNSDAGNVMRLRFTINCPRIETDYTGGQVFFSGKWFDIIRFHTYQNKTKIWI